MPFHLQGGNLNLAAGFRLSARTLTTCYRPIGTSLDSRAPDFARLDASGGVIVMPLFSDPKDRPPDARAAGVGQSTPCVRGGQAQPPCVAQRGDRRNGDMCTGISRPTYTSKEAMSVHRSRARVGHATQPTVGTHRHRERRLPHATVLSPWGRRSRELRKHGESEISAAMLSTLSHRKLIRAPQIRGSPSALTRIVRPGGLVVCTWCSYPRKVYVTSQ